ncbi:hypothetical protein BGZ95_008784, partial [Linnemannia exigua]
LSLPDIMDVVASHLTSPSLLNCMLVSQSWKTLFLPHLYSTITDTLYSWVDKFLTPPVGAGRGIGKYNWRRSRGLHLPRDLPAEWDCIDRLLALFTKYGHLIRHLTLTNIIIHDAVAASRMCRGLISLTSRIGGVIPNLPDLEKEHEVLWYPENALQSFVPERKVSFPSNHTREEREWVWRQWYWHLFRQNTATLRVVEFYEALARMPQEVKEDEVIELLGACPRLTRLVLQWPEFKLQKLVQQVPQLQHLTFHNAIPRMVWLLLDAPAPALSQLTTIRIVDGVSRGIIFSFLIYLPSLEHLWTGTRYETYSDPGQQLQMPKTPSTPLKSRLKGLHFTQRSSAADNLDHLMVAEILPYVPDLLEIGLAYLDHDIATALVAHCPRLQRFYQPVHPNTIHRSKSGESGECNSIGILLSSCPHLRELDSVHLEIDADYLIANSWICDNTLQTLRCQIVGVTRLSQDEEIDYNQGILFRYRLGYPLSEQESLAVDKHILQIRPQHSQIYAQLAKMTHLRVLELGTEYRDISLNNYRAIPSIFRGAQSYIDYGSPATDTLELSLVSGLGQLSTLKNLEVFGLDGVDYRINEEELYWMAKEWPRLKAIDGFQEVKGFWRLMHDGERWYRRVFMQMLRPDVRHRRQVVE